MKVFRVFTWSLIILSYFVGLNLPLVGPDEARYSQVAREMLERSDPVTPTLGGFEWFEKPALLYWLQMVSYKIFGVSEFSARFSSAVFGLMTVLSLYFLARLTTEDNRFAEVLAIVSATTAGMIVFSHAASFDIILTLPITISLSSFFVAFHLLEEEKFEKALIALFFFYFFIGVSVLAKGLVGFVIPFMTIFLFFVLIRRRPRKIIVASFPFGFVLSVFVAAVWYLPMYYLHGWRFIDEFIVQHHFERYMSNRYLHPQPFWFFWVVFPLMTIPWTPFFAVSVWKFFRGALITRMAFSKIDDKLRAFAFSWMIAVLVFFSFSGSKLPGYVLPALPAATILVASFIYQRNFKWIVNLAFLTAFFVIVFGLLFAEKVLEGETTKHLIRKADELGYKNAKILNLHTISHNLEFYGAGRLVRLLDGRQRYFYGAAEMLEFMRSSGEDKVLVIVPHRYKDELSLNSSITAEKIGENKEHSFFVVKQVN